MEWKWLIPNTNQREESFRRPINDYNGYYNYNTENTFKKYDKNYIESYRESQLNKYLDEKIERLKRIKNKLKPQRIIDNKNNKSTINYQKYSFDNYDLYSDKDKILLNSFHPEKTKRISEDKNYMRRNNNFSDNNIINREIDNYNYPKYIYNMNTIQNNNNNNNNNINYNNININNNNIQNQNIKNSNIKKNNIFQEINVANITFTPGLNQTTFSDFNLGKVSIQINGNANKKKNKDKEMIKESKRNSIRNSDEYDNLSDIADDLIKAFDLENNESDSFKNKNSKIEIENLKNDLLYQKKKKNGKF